MSETQQISQEIWEFGKDLSKEFYRKRNRGYAYKYYKLHKDKCQLSKQKYYQKNKQELKEKTKKYYQKLKTEGKLVYKSEYQLKYHKKIRQNIFVLLGGFNCIKCGFADKRALQIDHISGGGKKELEKFGGWCIMMSYYLKNPVLAKQKLQVLCANCNWIKRNENNEVHR